MFKQFKADAKNKLEKCIKSFQSDHGGILVDGFYFIQPKILPLHDTEKVEPKKGDKSYLLMKHSVGI